MDDRFDREFYRSQWQRVLPVGPHGIQPYVQTSRRARGLPTGRQGLIGLLAAVSPRRHRARAWGRERHGHAAAAADHRTARAGVVLGQGPRRDPTRPGQNSGRGCAALLKELKQLSALGDISAKHRAAKWVAIPAGDAWTGVTRMARTRDVLDELAEWYAPPASPAPAWHGAPSPRSLSRRLRPASGPRSGTPSCGSSKRCWPGTTGRASAARSWSSVIRCCATSASRAPKRGARRRGPPGASDRLEKSPCQTDWSRSFRRSHGGCRPHSLPAGYPPSWCERTWSARERCAAGWSGAACGARPPVSEADFWPQSHPCSVPDTDSSTRQSARPRRRLLRQTGAQHLKAPASFDRTDL